MPINLKRIRAGLRARLFVFGCGPLGVENVRRDLA
jgi:hypothetical protein